jgi:hypothetical protein
MNVLVKSDLWLGVAVLFGGFWAYLQCRGFDEHSSGYPSFISLVHIVLGVCLILNAIRQSSDTSDSVKRLFQEMRGPVVIVAMLMGWGALLLLDLGFLLSSCLMLPPILYALGYRGLKRLTLTTAGIVAAVFLLFYILFEVPLPLHPVVEQLFS